MKRLMLIVSVLLMGVSAVSAQIKCCAGGPVTQFVMNSLEGDSIPFSRYEGKVLLIVNTASKCGFTSQYAGLEKLYQKYKDRGLVILGFPCNQFGGQEPGSESEIRSTCLRNYGVTFPMFAKIDVNGRDEAPLYSFLKAKAPFAGYPNKELGEKLDAIHHRNKTGFDEGNSIRWNFTKFLVSKNGTTVQRFESMVTPEQLEQDIEKLLSE
jgi:glutathione peroxidase